MSLLFDEPFVAVFPSLVRGLGGDVAAAAVLQHIHFRARGGESVTYEGAVWFPVSRDELAAEIGLSAKQVKRIIDKLRAAKVIETCQIGGTDRRNYYRLSPKWAVRLVPNGTDGTDPNGTDGLVPNGTDVLLLEEGSKKIEEQTRVRKPVQADGPFDEFWKIYPRKQDKGHAKRAWQKATQTTDPTAIIDGAARYRDDPNREDPYTALPATWLNGERWLDEPLPERNNRNKVSEVQAMITRAAERDRQS